MNLYIQSMGRLSRRYRGTGIGANDLHDMCMIKGCHLLHACLICLSS